MLTFQHLFWNLPKEQHPPVVEYASEISNYAANRGFKAGEVVFKRLVITCDLCAMPIPVQHIFLINRDTDQRWCYECMEDKYRRESTSTIERPDILVRFEDKGQEY